MKQTIKVSARITENAVTQIKAELDAFGCKTVTQFVQAAVNEKLQRYGIGKMIESSIKSQEMLHAKLTKLSVIAAENNIANNKNIEELATALTKISAGFDAFSNKNKE